MSSRANVNYKTLQKEMIQKSSELNEANEKGLDTGKIIQEAKDLIAVGEYAVDVGVDPKATEKYTQVFTTQVNTIEAERQNQDKEIPVKITVHKDLSY